MPSRTALNLAGFAGSAAMLAFAFYSQYVMGLTPCHLCIFQRVAFLALLIVSVIAAVHAPK